MSEECKGKEKDRCNPPKCQYINGATRKYCKRAKAKGVEAIADARADAKADIIADARADAKVQVVTHCKGLEKKSCVKPCIYTKANYCRMGSTKKKKLSSLRSAVPLRESPLRPAVPLRESPAVPLKIRTPSSERSSQKTLKKRNQAGLLIKKLVYKNKNKIKAHFLKTVCSDSGYCITFGKESNNINKFFDLFHNFNYLNQLKIGSKGANGQVINLLYEREKYNTNAIIKTSINKDGDNLLYEYIVGHFFINEIYKKLPSFLQTYGLVKYKNKTDMENVVSIKNYLTKTNVYNFDEKDIETELKNSCIDTFNSILIENISNPETLDSKLKSIIKSGNKVNAIDFIKGEFYNILFQIYFSLNMIKNKFTHYDLHLANILIYEPISHAYIEYHYHYKGQIIRFKSKYIAKIIDYGRCYFNNLKLNSKMIYDKLCKIRQCGKCGYDYGYHMLTDRSKHHITSIKNNHSHDLRLLNEINIFFTLAKRRIIADKTGKAPPLIYILTEKVKYKSRYGTPENINSGLPRSINNIVDALTELVNYYFSNIVLSNITDYPGLKKIGDLHIYDDGRDMEFSESM